MTWDTIIDLEQALTNCHIDLIRDWYYDPWGWPELDWVAKQRPEIAYRRLNAPGARPVAKLDVAKENFSIRPAVVLDPVDRLIYQGLVDCVSRGVIGDLSSSVFGWRLPPGAEDPGNYARNDFQYENFRSRLTHLANTREAALKTDVVSCFASIQVDRLADGVHQRSGTGLVVERIIDLLQQWDRVDGRSGLPQRSLASCVLANFFLRPLDEVLNHYAPEPTERLRRWGTEGRSARWMDDIWLFDNDAGRLRRAQLDLQRQMEDIGLRMNVGKTDVIEGHEALVAAVLHLQHSAVEADLDGEKTLGPLNDLIDQLLARPETASRTSIRYVTTRMRQHELFERVEDFAKSAVRMPHASDGLARLFRDSGLWHDLQKWFVDYEQSAGAPWTGRCLSSGVCSRPIKRRPPR